MRTLAATFNTRHEAEAASRRLEAIGIARERIMVKDVVQTGAAPGGAGGVGEAFVSVKVTTEQVQAVTQILKAGGTAARQPEAVPTDSPEGQPVPPAASEPEPDLPPRPLPNPRAAMNPVAPAAEARPSHPPQRAPLIGGPGDRGRLGRYLIYYCLALVAAFIVGAWLGFVT